MLRRVVAAIGAVVVSVLLSGCSPEVLPLAAVAVDGDGTPRVLVRPCGDATYEVPTVEGWADSYEEKPGADEADTTIWEADGEWSGDVEFPLFSPPAAWEAQMKGERRLLPGHTYEFAFYGHTDDHAIGAVSFTAGDLERVERGQVWADDRVMSAGEFEELAEGAC